jgi:hypothetical protein
MVIALGALSELPRKQTFAAQFFNWKNAATLEYPQLV